VPLGTVVLPSAHGFTLALLISLGASIAALLFTGLIPRTAVSVTAAVRTGSEFMGTPNPDPDPEPVG
jgi:hypothetical protein